MITLKYCDWLTLANISEELLEQMLDMFDEAELSVQEIRSIGWDFCDYASCGLFNDEIKEIHDKMPGFVKLLEGHQVLDSERMKLLGELLLAFADHEDGKITNYSN